MVILPFEDFTLYKIWITIKKILSAIYYQNITGKLKKIYTEYI
jgi:hypothetical protein